MIHLPASVRVYLATTRCDMRRSFDGLHALVSAVLQLDAFAGHLFAFANKDTVLGPGWIRGMGQAAGGAHVYDTVFQNPARCAARSLRKSWVRLLSGIDLN
jgi:hypothetical protein